MVWIRNKYRYFCINAPQKCNNDCNGQLSSDEFHDATQLRLLWVIRVFVMHVYLGAFSENPTKCAHKISFVKTNCTITGASTTILWFICLR